MIRRLNINISDKTLKKIYSKIVEYDWNDIPSNNHWKYGTNYKYLKNISNYWLEKYNWKKTEKKINKSNHFICKIENLNIHFIYHKGKNPNSKPLLLTHGWPSSFIEYANIIDKLVNPKKFGIKNSETFDVIIPSLPGFGFSGKPIKPIGPRKMARILNKLMTQVLGYKKYIAHGSDFGAHIISWIGYDFPKYLIGIHINILIVRHPDGPRTLKEKIWEKKFIKNQKKEDGYRTQQATKPQTLSYAMMDSPIGIAAWILEKIHGWSDKKNFNINKFSIKEILITNIMIYLVTKTFNTSTWIYYGRREEGGRSLPKTKLPIKVPTGVAQFPKEYLEWPPKSYVRRIYNLKNFH